MSQKKNDNTVSGVIKEELKRRVEIANSISNHPDLYKICEGCDSIISSLAIFCPLCNAYRFNHNKIDILKQAEILSNKCRTSLTDEDYGLV